MTSPTDAEREARLAFAIPAIDQPPEGIDPAQLDPEVPDDRALLIGAAHPDLQAAIDNREETVVSGHVEYNPRLHLAMHELVATQIIEDDPPEVWRTAQRLREHGYHKHEILHMLAAAVSGEIWHVLDDHQGFDHDAHIKALEALPESWERQRPDGPAPPASRASHATRATAQRKATRAARRKNRRR